MQSSHPEGRRWRSLPDVLAEHTRRDDDHPLTPCLPSGVARWPVLPDELQQLVRDGARRVSFGDRRRPTGPPR